MSALFIEKIWIRVRRGQNIVTTPPPIQLAKPLLSKDTGTTAHSLNRRCVRADPRDAKGEFSVGIKGLSNR